MKLIDSTLAEQWTFINIDRSKPVNETPIILILSLQGYVFFSNFHQIKVVGRGTSSGWELFWDQIFANRDV